MSKDTGFTVAGNMKIRKFNEDISSVDMEYVHECFVEIFDNYEVNINKYSKLFTLEVPLDIKTSEGDHYESGYNINDIVKLANSFNNLVIVSEVAVEKIKNRLNYNARFDFFKNEGEDEKYYFTIEFNEN